MKVYISLILLIFSFQNFAQNSSDHTPKNDFIGQVFYESKTTVDLDAFGINREIPDAMKKMMADRMKSMLEKTYVLTFNKDESIYKEKVKVDANSATGNIAVMMSSFTPGPQYKNLKTKEMLEENEFFGTQFLITNSIESLDWKLGKESKQIGEYTVFKATAIKKVDPNDFQMARPKNQGNSKTESLDPMDLIEIPEEIEVTAWYTPLIAVSHGPGEYAGLPGLILELNVHRTTLLCSKIVMDPKNPDKIERPEKGQVITREEYGKIVKAKTEELRKSFLNRGN